MTRRQLPRGLYLLTPDEHDGERLLARTLPLLPFASCVQLRAKGLDRHVLMTAGQRLRSACRESDVAFIVNDDPGLARVAIGGITPENGGPLVAAGADLLAVISGVFDAADPAAAARAYLSCFKDPTPA